MKKINDNSPVGELSLEQKIWIGGGTFLRAIRPMILYVCLPALFMTIGMILMKDRTADDMISASGNFYYALGIIFTVVILHRRSKKRGSSLEADATLEYKELDKKKISTLLLMGLGFGFFFSALLTVFPFPKFLIESYRSSSNTLNVGTDQILALVSTAVLAPITEEIVFRGYMLNRLLEWFKEKESVLISTAIFALCHVSILWIAYAFVMGLLLAKVSVEEDNIAYSIALHIGFNASVVPIWIVNRVPVLERILFANNILIAIYGIVACYGAVQLYRKYRKETEKW
ncbi:MAG: CPBP family intramembrane metalloprotease [Lachnospiraceae bacterium]|nr:CPBP family intramembrane metalloprotease [Lachnospiraceae bacterium]